MNRRGFLSNIGAVIGVDMFGISSSEQLTLPCFYEMFLGDGIIYIFEMTYRAYNLSILEDGIEKRIGLKFITYPTFQVEYYLDYYNKMIERVAGPLPVGVTLECRYAIRLNEKLLSEMK